MTITSSVLRYCGSVVFNIKVVFHWWSWIQFEPSWNTWCKTPCRYLQQSPAGMKGKPQNLISHPTCIAFSANALNQRNHQAHKINIQIYLKTKSPGILKCTPKERIGRMHQHRIKCSQTNYLKSPGLGACTKVTSSHHHGLHQVSGWRSYFYNLYLAIWLSNAYVF